MATTLSPLGTLSYNGFDFGAYTETLSASVKPQYDSSERTVLFNRYSFQFRTLIHGNPTDDQIVAARRALSKPGAALTMVNRGLGDLSVNVGSVKDVAWGPKPQEISFKHHGRDQAVELVWSLDFAIPDCSQAKFAFAVMEFNYKLTFTVDRSGLTTRTYAGFLRIPMTRRRAADRTIPDSADSYREKIVPARVPGFRRIPGAFTLSEDRTRLDFSITDEQLSGPAPPPGVIDAKASHSLTTDGCAMVHWAGTLEASYEVAQGYPKDIGFKAFLALVKDRIDAAKKQLETVSFVLPVSFAMREPELYGRQTAAFSLSYTMIVDSLAELLTGLGLWRPVPNSDWKQWDSTVGASHLGARGIAGLRFNVGDDAITDLCGGNRAVPPGNRSRTYDRELRQTLRSPFDPPAVDSSWADYKCWIEIESDSGTSELRTLATKPLKIEPARGKGAQDDLPKSPVSTSRLVNDYVPPAQQPPVSIQRRTAPAVYLYLCGSALRAGFPIPEPFLAPINGVTPVPANRLDRREGFVTAIVGNVGVPLYGAKWRLRYAMPSVPAVGIDQIVPANPLLEGK